MPIYEYRCMKCGHRTDILHGINEPGPRFCPDCGTEGSMRKTISAPSVHFKGSGWAKKDRASATKTKAAAKAEAGGKPGDGEAKPGDGEAKPGDKEAKSGDGASKPDGGSASPGPSSKPTPASPDAD